jgi:hypothetical protein
MAAATWLTPCSRYALGQYGQVRHRQHRAIQRERQALHHADGDTHAGECARSTTESDGVDRLQRGPGIGQQLLDHRQQLLRMQARDHLVMTRDLAVVQQATEQASVAVSRASKVLIDVPRQVRKSASV